MTKELAECVGLWLAEGDNKSRAEVTFTNNCFELIEFFHGTLTNELEIKNKPRLYVYLPSKNSRFYRLNQVRLKAYLDTRARKPYYIYRVSGRKLIFEWRKIVEKICKNRGFYAAVLRGFFAGEGSVKQKENSRVIRIAQKKRSKTIERILRALGISWRFSANHRSYGISNKKNLEKLERINLARLHPEKSKRFEEMMSSYSQEQFQRNAKTLEKLTIRELVEPVKSRTLSKKFGRSLSRVQQVLNRLKRRGLVNCFRIESTNYWISSNEKTVLISKRKGQILSTLKETVSVKGIAEKIGGSRRALCKRLQELERLGLATKVNNLWRASYNEEEMLVAGVDEAGRGFEVIQVRQ